MKTRTIAAVLLTALSCTTPERSRMKAFRDQLRCGQTPAEVQAIAQRGGGTGWLCATPAPSETRCTFESEETRIIVTFVRDGLKTVDEGKRFGFTGMATYPRLDICSGESSRRFVITAPTEAWVGATISADGKVIARIRYRNDSAYLPVGRHTVRIEKAGMEAVVREIDVPGGLVRDAPQIELP